ncbi:hypothetical protein HMI54_003008 [Coelomomyces lativittatus]|nr:hypothetical protein HMI55_000199 [Coelomomyces lativittatus]KAJ1512745.1 hypothetical protein HMI56_003617 [Coelomomyces lativittatus]KAJ1518027.1 hypothetical protein HMI54_003008 [Coelomomyces lativittatus]
MNQNEDTYSTLVQIQRLAQNAHEQVRILKARCTSLEAEKESLKKHIEVLQVDNNLNLQRIAEKDEALETISESVQKAVTEFIELRTRFEKTVAENERLSSELLLTNNRFKLYEALIPAHQSLTSLCPPMYLSHENLEKEREKLSMLGESHLTPPASAPPRMVLLDTDVTAHSQSPKGNISKHNAQSRRNTLAMQSIRLASPKDLNVLFHKLEADLASIQTRSTETRNFGA